jgi:hypothetical protein
MYTAVVLTDESRKILLQKVADHMSEYDDVLAHHMTVNMGTHKPEVSGYKLGDKVSLQVVGIAKDEKVCAVKVECEAGSTNDTKHITVAVNRAKGGKPFLSNKLNWENVSPMSCTLSGILGECA